MPEELKQIENEGHDVVQFTPYHFRVCGKMDIFWSKGNRVKRWMNPETKQVGIIDAKWLEDLAKKKCFVED